MESGVAAYVLIRNLSALRSEDNETIYRLPAVHRQGNRFRVHPTLIRKTGRPQSFPLRLARGSDMLSFQTIAGPSHDFITGIGFNLTSEISPITALRLCNPQLLDVAIG